MIGPLQTIVALAAVFSTVAAAPISQERGLSPLDLLGGPEGIALSLFLDTPVGKKAEDWLEAKAKTDGKSVYEELATAISAKTKRGLGADIKKAASAVDKEISTALYGHPGAPKERGIKALDELKHLGSMHHGRAEKRGLGADIKKAAGGVDKEISTALYGHPGAPKERGIKALDELKHLGSMHHGRAEKRGLSPIDLLGGPEGIALSLFLDTSDGKKAEDWLEAKAKTDGKSVYEEIATALTSDSKKRSVASDVAGNVVGNVASTELQKWISDKIKSYIHANGGSSIFKRDDTSDVDTLEKEIEQKIQAYITANGGGSIFNSTAVNSTKTN